MTNPADVVPQANKADHPGTTEVAQLQEALVEALRAKEEVIQSNICAIKRQAELQMQIDDLHSKTAPPAASEPCYLLKKIPIEIRNHIYGYLLESSLLSQPDSINRSSNHGTITKLDLSPSILRVNRQIYNEASDILYGSNTFHVECLYRHIYPMSTITRKIDSCGHHETYASMASVTAARKVKHWKVVVTAYKGCAFEAASPDFVDFCRAVCDTRPHSLTIVVIPEGMERQNPTSFSYEPQSDSYNPLRRVLQPLDLFRGVKTFQVREATDDELPSPPASTATHSNPPRWGQRTPVGHREIIPESMLTVFRRWVEGHSPIEYAFKMQNNLLAYAQGFERYEPFKSAMDIAFGTAELRIQDRESWEHEGPSNWCNPYKTEPEFHPIEDNLQYAFRAADTNNVQPYKEFRQIVLQKLEPQYQRIIAASMALNNFIKYHKTPCGLFDTEPHTPGHCGRGRLFYEYYTIAIMLLEAYANSFKRDTTPFVALQIRKYQRKFDLCYSIFPREQLLAQLSNIHEREMSRAHPDFGTFVPLFRQCVDDCDTQYLVIRKARKAIYEWDSTTINTDSFTQPWRCDEMVNWEVNETLMEVPERPGWGSEAHANPNGPGGAGLGTFLQNMFGPGGQTVVVGTGPMPPMPPGGFGVAFGPPPPQINVNNAINQALLALQGMWGPPPHGLFAAPPNAPPALPPAPAAPLNVPHAPLTNHGGAQAQASTSTAAQPGNVGGGLYSGQWLNDFGWTTDSDSEEENEDEDDEDGGGYDSVNDSDEDENSGNDEEDSDEELPSLILGV